jgi:flagellar motor switch/type III secretory pathway protein FliN
MANNEESTEESEKLGSDKLTSLFDDSFFDDDDDNDDDNDDFDLEDSEIKFSQAQNEQNDKVDFEREIKGAVINSVEKNSVTNATEKSISISNNEKSNSNFSNSLAQEIQFRLGCELGQVLISYENLANLNVGSVVNFDNTLQTLYLTVNNIRVGEGMLVDIDGKIGIKITRWYGHV